MTELLLVSLEKRKKLKKGVGRGWIRGCNDTVLCAQTREV